MEIERVSNLEFKKWTELRDAIEKLYNDGFYDKLVSVHDNQYRIHNNLRFLPWHRVYLFKFERALRTIDSSLSIPYWDWETDIGKLDGFEDFHDITGAKRHFGNPWFIDGIATVPHSSGTCSRRRKRGAPSARWTPRVCATGNGRQSSASTVG